MPTVISRHPAGFTALLGFVLLVLATGATLTVLGLLLLCTGLVAGIGGRSLRRRNAQASAAFPEETPIETLSAGQLEQLVAVLLARAGHDVHRARGPRGARAGLVLGAPGQFTVVEIKRSSRPLGEGSVQAVLRSMTPYRTEKGMLVTNSVFTERAILLARGNGVLLWDRHDLWDAMVRSTLHPPPRAQVGWGLLGVELRAGVPIVTRAAGVAMLSLLVASVLSGSRRRR